MELMVIGLRGHFLLVYLYTSKLPRLLVLFYVLLLYIFILLLLLCICSLLLFTDNEYNTSFSIVPFMVLRTYFKDISLGGFGNQLYIYIYIFYLYNLVM